MKRPVVDLKEARCCGGGGWGGVKDCQMYEKDLIFLAILQQKFPQIKNKTHLKNQHLTLTNENEEHLISKTFKTSIW